MTKPAITKRTTKGSALSYEELDTNFQNLADATFAIGVPGTTTRTAKTVTANGGTVVSSSQSKFGGGSVLFDGSADYLSIPTSADFAMGTGDFTVEMWIYKTANFQQRLYDNRTSNVATTTPMLQINNINQLDYTVNNSTQITGSVVTNNTWHHVAVSRASGNTKLFLDGVQQGSTYVDSNNYTQHPLRIGASAGTADFGFSGYIDEIRVSKGIARYTANFTPSVTAFDNDTYTQLLIHADSTITDDNTLSIDRVSGDLNGIIKLLPGGNVTLVADVLNGTITIDSGVPVGIVNPGDANRLSYYPAAGSTVDDTLISYTTPSGVPTLSSTANGLTLNGGSTLVLSAGVAVTATSGNVTLTAQATGQTVGLEYPSGSCVRVGTSGINGIVSTYPNRSLRLDTGWSSAGYSSPFIQITPGGNIELSTTGYIKVNSTSGTPSNTTTPDSWLKLIVGSTAYYLPLFS